MLLNVITACIRPANLSKILQSLIVSNKPKILIHWYIITKEVLNNSLIFPPEIIPHFLICKKSFGILNDAFDVISHGMVCAIDDDNIMHPDFISEISQIIKTNGDNIGILYPQDLGKLRNSSNQRIRVVNSNLIGPQQIDTAQFVIDRKLIGGIRWPIPEDRKTYCPDGTFIEAVYKQHRDSFIIIDKVLCYYNYLVNCDSLEFA